MVSNPIPTCNQELRKMGKVYPRTCRECGLGPCKLFTPPPNPTVTVNDTERKDFESAMNQARFFPAELSFERIKSPSGRDEYRNSHLQSAWEGWQAALSIEAQPEVTGAVAQNIFEELGCNNASRLNALSNFLIRNKKGECVFSELNNYIEIAIQAAVREKLEAALENIDAFAKMLSEDEWPNGWDTAKSFAHTPSGNDPEEERDYWRGLATKVIRALMESPQPSVEEPAN